jgi:outer membrane biosynthesis protein TonB
MTLRSLLSLLVGAAGGLAACSSSPPPEADISPQVLAEGATGAMPVAAGDCVEALRRAAEKPDLVVDQLPVLVIAKPAPLQNPPRSALRKDGSAEVKIDILVDTLGKAVMKTFKVVASSNSWLETNVKSVIGKWKFSPAQLAGCKVPRIYHFYAAAPPRAKSGD